MIKQKKVEPMTREKLANEVMSLQGFTQVKIDGSWKKTSYHDAVKPKHGAVIVCDMWNDHWCKGAARRVAELAPHVNRFINFMRNQGFLIVHCPSNTMEYYKDHPARQRILTAPEAPADPALKEWCYLDPTRESLLPFDDSDGGCNCGNHCTYSRPYTHQNDDIEIDEELDVIGDGFEVYNYLRMMDIEKIFYCGVHANICIPGRKFGIRQMTYQGIGCILVRDLIDVMYNPAMPPRIDHFDAIDHMAWHMQKYWCPSVYSSDLIGGYPFRFREDYRLF